MTYWQILWFAGGLGLFVWALVLITFYARVHYVRRERLRTMNKHRALCELARTFDVGTQVRVVSGPFAGCEGKVSDVFDEWVIVKKKCGRILYVTSDCIEPAGVPW